MTGKAEGAKEKEKRNMGMIRPKGLRRCCALAPFERAAFPDL